MGILWDAVLAGAIAAELNERLRGARLSALHLDHAEEDLRLYLREGLLVFRLHPSRARLLLLEAAEPPESARPAAAGFEGAGAPPDERRLELRFRRVRGAGPRELGITAELRPNRLDAVVWSGEERRIRHVLTGRLVGAAPGQLLPEPDPSPRKGAQEVISLDDWTALLEEAGEDPAARRSAILRNVAFSSSLNVDALIAEAVPGPPSSSRPPPHGPEADRSDAEPGYRLWTRLREAAGGACEPALLHTAGQEPQPYPLPLPGVASEPVATLLDAMLLNAEEGAAEPGALALPAALLRALEEEAERRAGTLRGLERSLDQLPDPGGLRATAELILARLAELPEGAERIRLSGFSGEEVEVTLDPALRPHQNANAYFERARRAERAAATLPGRIREARAALSRIGALLDAARSGAIEPDELERRVRDEVPQRTGRGAGPDRQTLPYRRFRSSGGLEIRVGRSSRQNDDLTFRNSAPDDVWLHAQQVGGAHVILRWGRSDAPPSRDLREAAALAALHSRARGSALVPVVWTWRKYVRKPRKAPPGTVVPERVTTLFVEPRSRLDEL